MVAFLGPMIAAVAVAAVAVLGLCVRACVRRSRRGRRSFSQTALAESTLPLFAGDSTAGLEPPAHCIPSTCECGSSMCAPVACAQRTAEEFDRQCAELARDLRNDARMFRAAELCKGSPPKGVLYDPDPTMLSRKLLVTADTLQGARALLDHVLDVRAKEGFDDILEEPLPPELVAHIRRVIPHAVHGTDRWGHPIYIERVGAIKPSELTALWAAGAAAAAKADSDARKGVAAARRRAKPINLVVRYHFQLLELARLSYEVPGRRTGCRVSKTTAIVDLAGLRLGMFANKACIERLTALARIGDAFAVDNLAAVWVVNAPWFFAKCWQAVSHILGARTTNKLRVLPPRDTPAFLRSVVEPAELPAILGGKCTCANGGCVSGGDGPDAATRAQREADARIQAWAAAAGKLPLGRLKPAAGLAPPGPAGGPPARTAECARSLARSLARHRWLSSLRIFACVRALGGHGANARDRGRPEATDPEIAAPAGESV